MMSRKSNWDRNPSLQKGCFCFKGSFVGYNPYESHVKRGKCIIYMLKRYFSIKMASVARSQVYQPNGTWKVGPPGYHYELVDISFVFFFSREFF